MPDALARLYNRFDCRPPKHLLEAALTGKSQTELAIDRLRSSARWNMHKADDWENAARLAEGNGNHYRAILQRKDAKHHRKTARKQFKEAAKLARREAEGRAA